VTKYGHGIYVAAEVLSLPLWIHVKDHPIDVANGIVEATWTFQESFADAHKRVPKIELAVREGSFKRADFEMRFESRGVLGLGRATQVQRERYASGVMKTVFEKFAQLSNMLPLPSEVRGLIVSLVEPEFSKFLGTSIDQLVSHNAGETPAVFTARIISLRATLDVHLEDASIVTSLLKIPQTVFSVATGFGPREPFDMSREAFGCCSPCGARGEETSTYLPGFAVMSCRFFEISSWSSQALQPKNGSVAMTKLLTCNLPRKKIH
jgi:hypothetical protein